MWAVTGEGRAGGGLSLSLTCCHSENRHEPHAALQGWFQATQVLAAAKGGLDGSKVLSWLFCWLVLASWRP